MIQMKRLYWIILCFVLLVGCAGPPIREAIKVDLNVPVGRIEENKFIGIRYPFNVTVPLGWRVTTEIPDFMVKLGYERSGLEESEVFIYNPSTQSNLQIDFTPAGRYTKFSQELIEHLTSAAQGSFIEELQKEHGKDIQAEIGPTIPFSLKGVQFAARKYATYTLKGGRREQGWIYAFTEPYQIFILYMILEKEEANDRKDLWRILDTFEVSKRE